MSEGWTYRRLCDAYREERSSNALSKLDSNFAQSLEALISELSSSSSDPGAHRELENARRQALALMALRRKKIINLAANTHEGPEPDGMAVPEHALYDKVLALCKEEDALLGKMLYGKPKTNGSNGSSLSSPPPLKKIRLLKEVPAYRGADSAAYGPFSSGQLAELPESEAGWMIKGGMAQAAD